MSSVWHKAPPVITNTIPCGGRRSRGGEKNSDPDISKPFPHIFLYLHLDLHQPRSFQPVSGKGSLMRITNLLSPLTQAQAQPNQVLQPFIAQDLTQIKADRSVQVARSPGARLNFAPRTPPEALSSRLKRPGMPGMELTSES